MVDVCFLGWKKIKKTKKDFNEQILQIVYYKLINYR